MLMLNEYEEKRYQVTAVSYGTVNCKTRTTVYYTDDFFDATNEARECLPNYHHVEIFDSVAGRILFDSADLD